MSVGGFLWEHLSWAFISWIWYKNTLFRCIGTNSLASSRWVLIGIVMLCCITGIVSELQCGRNGFSVFVNLMMGFGIYTVLTYMKIRKTLINITLCIVVVLCFAFTGLVMFRKIRNKRKAKKIIWRRLIRSFRGAKQLTAIGLAIIVFISGAGNLFGSGIMKASVKPATGENVSEQTISNNIETILLLQDELWVTLSVQQKLNVLQTVANIEQRYLGLSNELNVGAANLKDGVLAYYTDDTHEIIVSMDGLLYDSSWALLDSVCHEAFHSYQHRLVDAYNNASAETKSLRIFRKAMSYADEFGDYISGKTDFYGYYSQDCESDARDYADEAVIDYYTQINDYALDYSNQVDS